MAPRYRDPVLRESEPISDSDAWRWQAVCERNAHADGAFFYAVVTTGIYCRPSCVARRPRRGNVVFHDTPDAAEAAGFRPCKRCRPRAHKALDEKAALVVRLCRFIDGEAVSPTLSQLATHVAYSRFHLQRVFRGVTGITPRAYAAAVRADRLRRELQREPTVVRAMLAAGYNSSGRLYEQTNPRLGMTPTAFREGGTACEIGYAVATCTLGIVLVASTDKGVCAILLGDEAEPLVRDLSRRFPNAVVREAAPLITAHMAHVVELIERPHTPIHLPLDIRGTVFQERVWQALQAIPVGQVTTYSGLAQQLGMPSAARAVAGACAANAHAVVIPCHRVLRRDGELSGYRWGVTRKRELLTRERDGVE